MTKWVKYCYLALFQSIYFHFWQEKGKTKPKLFYQKMPWIKELQKKVWISPKFGFVEKSKSLDFPTMLVFLLLPSWIIGQQRQTKQSTAGKVRSSYPLIARLVLLFTCCDKSLKSEFCHKSRLVLFFLPCKKNTNNCTNKDNRRYSDKQPFKWVKCHSKNSGFGVTIIPSQIRAF